MRHALKAVLINPPVPDNKKWVREGRCQQWDIWGAPFPPFSLASTSTQIRKEGVETLIIDAGPSGKGIDEVIEDCRLFGPQLAILATSSPTVNTDLGWFAEELKRHLPKLQIAAIGIHVSTLPVEVLKKFNALDFAVMGEPETTCRELVVSVLQNGSPIGLINGIAYRTQSGEFVINKKREFEENLDTYGMPDWSSLNFENYKLPIKNKPFSLIGFSRGCPHKCTYCATHPYNGVKLRKRSVATLIEEIKYNLSLGVKDFLFWTELMTFDKTYLNEFLDAVFEEELHKKISWVCNSRVDSADLNLFKKMKAAGCWQIAFGFEFGDDRILTLAGKGGKATIKQGRIAANLANKARLFVDGHFIMGYPGETEATMQATIDFACSLPLTFAHFYACVPFPGSRLYKQAADAGWFEKERWDLINQDIPVITKDGIEPEITRKYISRAYRKFYSRPGVIWRGLMIPESPGEYVNLVKLGTQFYRDLALN